MAPFTVLTANLVYTFYGEDLIKYGNPNSTLKEKNEATLSLLNPFAKAVKITKGAEAVKDVGKGIELFTKTEKNGKKVKEASVTEKEMEQLGAYVEKLNKGTGKGDDFAKEPFVPDEYWQRKAPDNATPGSKIEHYRDYKGKEEIHCNL